MIAMIIYMLLKFREFTMRIGLFGIAILLVGFLGGCTPTVKVEAPSEPININLNVKIQHEIYIKVDKELDNILNSSSGLF